MTTTEKKDLRKVVKQYIDRADDRMLKAVRAMLEADQKKYPEIDEEWPEISDEERASIEVGLKQLRNGEGIPHEEAVKRLKWYPK